eukprot:NODE_201_length_2346_cov_121.999549_g195_i0.p1 GENE.NODE_201_length_2346_cov_121.999549_g195_i0~~NODE_201_length_2346_cov_121.999549_g195_i0.p1  ORF type:complete len:481 (+),score=127.50 NODE_201_length_2346_cov_121.999549_g195_i0:738-2180(+)
MLVSAIIHNSLKIPDWKSFKEDIRLIYEHCRKYTNGKNADYIPQLATVEPEQWGVSVCTVDGQRLDLGDCDVPYTIQSTSKPFTYCLARSLHSEQKTHTHVGREPSGQMFNAITVDSKGRPHNPMINAGAIVTAGLIDPASSVEKRLNAVLSMWQRATADSDLPKVCNDTYRSESGTANRNRALSYFMADTGAFPTPPEGIESTLALYFQACSILRNSAQQAVAAATLAAGGVCPLTSDRVFNPGTVQNCLSLMLTCGMYDYSGEFAYHIGIPAKSGVAGAVMLVIPDVMGICTWSPRLDKFGNSVRGIEFSKLLTRVYNFHQYDIRRERDFNSEAVRWNNNAKPKSSNVGEDEFAKKDPINKDGEKAFAMPHLFAAAAGDLPRLRSLAAQGLDISAPDYDGRTAIHLACAEKQEKLVLWLLARGDAPVDAADRFGHTPLEEAKRVGADRVCEILQAYKNKESLQRFYDDMDDEDHSTQV